MKNLTERQKEILSYISEYITGNGRAPTLREIGDRFGFSHIAARDMVLAIVRKGYLERGENELRSISLPLTERIERENLQIPFFASEPTLEEVGSEHTDRTIYVPRAIAEQGAYAFRVSSESMRNAGILPGDIAVMTHLKGAPKNDWIILASCSDDAKPLELRRFMRINDDFIQLCPENDTMGVIKASYASLTTAGVLCMIRRDYEPHPPRA